jgi:plastocyanin
MRIARLAALVVAVTLATAACSGSSSPAPSAQPSVASSAAQSGGIGITVSIANFSFQPATITVPVGATVTWTNNDTTGHTVTADGGSFKSNTLAPGAGFSHTFAAAGTFAYHCSIHASMKAAVTMT